MSTTNYSLRKDIEVRWGDLDAFNHVNNTCFLRYIEEARLDWFYRLHGGWQDQNSGPVVVNVNCNFRLPIHWPARLWVETQIVPPSGKSVVLKHRIVDQNETEKVYADAEVTLVWIDRHSNRAILPPTAIQEYLQTA